MIAKEVSRKRRHIRIRKKISGTAERPRLCVFRSLTNIYAQIIDDVKGVTIVAASSQDKEIKETKGHKGNVDAAKKVGALVAAKAQKAGIKSVVFDRGGYVYHGRIKALAESARETGLEF
ncbi:MAG: 50S ribosomal protein L18 [Dissulfurispiraceae bacterium]|nr:50S ribosomal protein L18 [Dissulfurispiraceae bacterium]